MPGLSARAQDPAVVTGELDRYLCRTIADVDHHLAILCARMRLLREVEAMRRHMVDRDRLLDRRLWLMALDTQRDGHGG